MQKSPLLTRHSGTQSSPTYIPLVLDTPNETITDRVGIREVHVANNQIYVNGQSIKFHGVNRHESDPSRDMLLALSRRKKICS